MTLTPGEIEYRAAQLTKKQHRLERRKLSERNHDAIARIIRRRQALRARLNDEAMEVAQLFTLTYPP